jgi:cell division protein ZapA
MGQVAITLNGKIYRLACEDGDEVRLKALSLYISSKLDGLTREFGQAGDAKLFLMSALLIADELFELREKGSGLAGSQENGAKSQNKTGAA